MHESRSRCRPADPRRSAALLLLAVPPGTASSSRLAPFLRALVVAAGLALGGGTWCRPGKPGLHRRLVWLSVWLMPAGLACSALWPDYRVATLHVLFIGGFGLMALGVATHVSLGHLGLEELARGRPRAVVILGVALVLALLGRVAADVSHTPFEHLASAAACWVLGTAVWLHFLAPKLLGRASS